MNAIRESLLKLNIFEENEYFDKYVDLIERNKENIAVMWKTQKHHIIPKHYYKENGLKVDNSKSNLVNLNYSDHIFAHYYLSLCSLGIYKSYNQGAFMYLTSILGEDKSLIYDLDRCDEIYEEFSKHMHDIKIGKKLSEETIRKLKEARIGRELSEETRKKISDKNKGNLIGRVHIFKDDEEKIVREDELEEYFNLGYQRGRCEKTKKSLSSGYNYSSKGMLGKKQSEKQREAARIYSMRLKTEEVKKRMSVARLGKVLISKDGTNESFYVYKDELQEYLDRGYRKGRLKK